MSRILLVIGLASSKSHAEPELVYLGRSGGAMRDAISKATHPRLIIVPHVQGYPKNNPRAAANLVAQEADEARLDQQLRDLLGAKDDEAEAEIAELKKLLSLAEDSYRSATERAEKLAAELATLTEKLNDAQREASEAKEALARVGTPAVLEPDVVAASASEPTSAAPTASEPPPATGSSSATPDAPRGRRRS